MTIGKKMNKCFMNGKSCIYEREIDLIIENRDHSKEKKAFVIMPFGEQLDVLYQWQIAPFFKNGGMAEGDNNFRCTPERADDIRQVGFIICEKICKKIQEANYVVVDVSFDNPNVFYELGLATALKKQIIPICVSDKISERQSKLKNTCGIERLLPYPRFDMLEERIQDFVWNQDPYFDNLEQMNGDQILVIFENKHFIYSKGKYEGEKYSFGSFCKTAVGTAISNVFSDENKSKNPELRLYSKDRLDKIKIALSIDSSEGNFKEVINESKKAACILVDVSLEKSISNFFWLGYIHGIGGNAIPVNSYRPDTIVEKSSYSPFDIRALWHIVFREDHPIELENSLTNILEYIYIIKSKYLNRESFWKEILKDNKISIFLGSLYLKNLGRNTIGDWDYRTAAEITSYLSSTKETMKVTLKSPLPKCESNPDAAYIKWLKSQLSENCIIVASADVNDLTEYALCQIFKQKPFKEIDNKSDFIGYIAYKTYKMKTENKDSDKELSLKEFPDTAFYIREEGDKEQRGFIIRTGMKTKSGINDSRHITYDHFYPDDKQSEGQIRRLLGQLVVAKNPFNEKKWIVIISGISGPATLAIAQMLTGCIYKEFTINQSDIKIDKNIINDKIEEYNKMVNPELIDVFSKSGKISFDSLSEHLLKRLLEVANKNDGKVTALIDVDVYYPPKSETLYSNDERKIVGWQFANLKDVVGNWENPNNLEFSVRK